MLVAGCIVEPPGAKSAKPPEQPQRLASVAASPVTAKINANLEDKIEIGDVVFRPGQIRPGELSQVSVGLRVLSRLERDYQIFVHVESADNQNERVNVDHKPLGGSRPTTNWTKGEVLTDDFAIFVPQNSTARGLNVWFGFWHPDTGARLTLRNPGAVGNDGQNRVLLARIPVVPP